MNNRTGIYLVEVQAHCCAWKSEIWSVRAKSKGEASMRVKRASKAVEVRSVKSVSGSAWRQFLGKMG